MLRGRRDLHGLETLGTEPRLALSRHVGPAPFEQGHEDVSGLCASGRRVGLRQRRLLNAAGAAAAAAAARRKKRDRRRRERQSSHQGADSNSTTPRACGVTSTAPATTVAVAPVYASRTRAPSG